MRDLLVLCPDLPPSPALHYAASLAALCDASVSALQVCEPYVPVQTSALPAASGMVAALAQDCISRARQAEPEFSRWALHAGLARSNWLAALGPVPEAVAHAANWHDLLIVERNDSQAWGTCNAIGQLLLRAGVPLLVLPPQFAAPASLDCIAVAWNGSPESTRALHGALPLLRRARSVLLLRGQRPLPYSSLVEPPPFDPVAWLEGHGVALSHCLLERPHEHDGLELLERTSNQRADLLVMGGYGRSRFAEWALGGATRHVLRQARMPVLLRH